MEYNYWRNDSVFNEYSEYCGNSFEAIRIISNCGRLLAEGYNNRITHSQALNWVVTGNIPSCLFREDSSTTLELNRVLSVISDNLEYVDDKDIRTCVNRTIIDYLETRHLVYQYQESLDDFQKSRVRVLCNMILDLI